jgi:lambda family phage portal protein
VLTRRNRRAFYWSRSGALFEKEKMKLRTTAQYHGPQRRNFVTQTRGQAGYAMGNVDRLLADWVQEGNISNDAMLRSQLLRMRSRSRDLERKDPYMVQFIRLCKANIVGPHGVGLQMDITDPDGLNDVIANDAVELSFADFSKRENFTTSQEHDRTQLENLAIETVVRDGGFLARKVRYYDNPHRFSLQPIEVDYIDEEKNTVLASGNEVRLGVERNTWGKIVALWLRASNPGDTHFNSGLRRGNVYGSERQDAKDYIYLKLPKFIEQSQGVPWCHCVGTGMQHINGFTEAAVITAREAACKNTYLTQKLDSTGSYTGTAVNPTGGYMDDMSPGQKEVLPVGMSVETVDPAYPNVEFAAFMKTLLQGIAAGLGVSYNGLAKDLEGVSYSSLRAGFLEDRDLWMLLQSWFIVGFHLQYFSDWLEMALMAGKVQLLNGKALPYARFEKMNKPVFQGRRWSWVDPEKDVKAAVESIKQRLKSRSEVIAEGGGTMDGTMRAFHKDKEIAADYGIDVDPEQAKQDFDAYGVAVRAGVITPTIEDEIFYRKKYNLPPLSKKAKEAWAENPARQPVTLQSQQQQGAGGGMQNQPGKGDDDSEASGKDEEE